MAGDDTEYIRRLLSHLSKVLMDMSICSRCGARFSGKTCSTCDATQYAAGDAYTMLCAECGGGFATADPHRDLCCFCMRRSGDYNGRNRQAYATAPRRSHRKSRGSTRTGITNGTPWYSRTRAWNSIPNAGIRTGEIIGWRCWRAAIVDNKLRLKSIAVDCVWEPNAPISINSIIDQCGYTIDRWQRVPPGIGAGVHAFKSFGDALNQYGHGERLVYGTVALWGEVIEHTQGYRAEFGRVNTLDFGHIAAAKMLERLRQEYGVHHRSWKDFIKRME